MSSFFLRPSGPTAYRASCAQHINENSSYNANATHTRRMAKRNAAAVFLTRQAPTWGTLSGERQVKKIIRFHAGGELQPVEVQPDAGDLFNCGEPFRYLKLNGDAHRFRPAFICARGQPASGIEVFVAFALAIVGQNCLGS